MNKPLLLITLLTFGSCSSTTTRDQGAHLGGISRSHILETEDMEYAMAYIVGELAWAGVLSHESTVALGRSSEACNVHCGK